VVTVTPGSIHSHQEVAALAADLKGQAKRSKNGIAVRQSHSIQVTQQRAHQIS